MTTSRYLFQCLCWVLPFTFFVGNAAFADDESSANRLFVGSGLLMQRYEAIPADDPNLYVERLELLKQIRQNLTSIVEDYSGSSLAVQLISEGRAKMLVLTEIEGAIAELEEKGEFYLITDLQELRTRLVDTDAKLTSMTMAFNEQRRRSEESLTLLSDAEANRLVEAAATEALRARLENADAELTAMTLALEEQRRRAEETLTILAAAQAATDALAEADAARAAAMTEAERQAALLAVANAQLAEAEAASAESQRQVALLNEQVAALRQQLGALQGLLDDSAARDAAADVQIANLGTQLNAALARVAAEQRQLAREQARVAEFEVAEAARLAAKAQDLSLYRSVFFGRLQTLLEGREGVSIERDRFVFSSEVLFEIGSADLAPAGLEQIANVAGLLNEVAGEIPDTIDWILRVDGHTDNRPLRGDGDFASNWELSQARALSVVQYLAEELGFPSDRLAATGFGEYNPVATNDTAAGRAQNRRIELKLTER
jgi:chemotaxis protein MotB